MSYEKHNKAPEGAAAGAGRAWFWAEHSGARIIKKQHPPLGRVLLFEDTEIDTKFENADDATLRVGPINLKVDETTSSAL